MAPSTPVRPPDVSYTNSKYSSIIIMDKLLQPPLEDIFDDEKSAKRSPPESEKDAKIRDRDVSLSMAPLPIPLGPLGNYYRIFYRIQCYRCKNLWHILQVVQQDWQVKQMKNHANTFILYQVKILQIENHAFHFEYLEFSPFFQILFYFLSINFLLIYNCKIVVPSVLDDVGKIIFMAGE